MHADLLFLMFSLHFVSLLHFIENSIFCEILRCDIPVSIFFFLLKEDYVIIEVTLPVSKKELQFLVSLIFAES